MADNLIFPIGFDLESGVKDAIKKGEAALRQIEAAMNRKPIVLRAEVDANKFQMFSRQFSNSIDGISAKLAQAQRIWNSMSFDVKFDSEGNLSRRAQIVFDAFQQLTQASTTMGQRLGEVNRSLAKSEADTARAITAEYNKRQQLINEQIRLKERQAAAEERVRQSQLKGVNVGYVETQRQVDVVRNLRLQYEAILPMLNAMAQRRYDIKVGIDKQFEADIQRINAEIARLRQSNLQLGAKGDTNAIQANLQAIRQLEAELQRISQQKIDLLNTNKINSDIARLRTEISSVFGELQSAERRLASGNSLNAALDAQSQKVLKLHADIQKLDQQFAQLNATGKVYNQDGTFTAQANTLLQQRIALTKQLEQEAITGQQAQIKLEQQLREEKRQTEQAAKNAAKEAERQAKAEATARKQAQDAANAENKARQEAYNARRRQGQETQRILNKEAKSIADITAKLQIQQQRLQSANIGSAKFNKIAEEVKRLTADLEKANQKMRELTGQTQSSAATQSAAVRQVSREFQAQDGYVSRLLKRMAVYASFSYASNFLTSVREVTAQFELQRVSLGAIIQDQSRANQLWAEIKTFALKSPVKILDLTKYTKQVAAYGVETDKLFDTTKRIMDISVGLGVDASRLVLAYGQVKAASYLRAAEIRQFTEAGIPMLELLADKFTELNGKAVTTEQVMDMVSKRMVGFDMVEQLFKDMTSAGGMFFDMQEKQGNTLFGLWAKLGDAASVMYDEIGNTDYINSGMKDLIQLFTDLMKNWRLVGREMAVVTGTFLLLRANTVLSAQGTALATKATSDYAVATTRLNAAQKRGAQTAAYVASLSKKAAVLNRAASISTNVWTAATLRLQAAMYSLKAAFIGNWVTLAIAAVAAIGAALYSAYEKAHKLQNELKEIGDAGQAESAKSVFNFERLANAALEAATGSREQKEALDELKRSYGDIIPVEQLSLENLQKLRAQGYEPLTAAIKEYIAQRTLQKEIDAITSHYTEDTIAKQRQLRELFKRGSIYSFFKGVAWSPIESLDDDQISQLFANVDKIANDKSKSWEDVWVEAIKGVTDVSEDAEKKMRNMFVNETQNAQQQSYNNMMRNIVENTRNLSDETDTATKKMETQTGSLGKYKKTLDETSKSLVNLRLLYTDGKEVDASSFLGKQMVSNASIKAWKDDIIENLQGTGIEVKNEWFSIIENLNPKDASKISSINFAPILDAVDAAKDKLGDSYVQLRNSIVKYQELYDGVVPSDRTVSAMRSRLMQIANNVDKTGNIMNDLQRHLMKSSDNWENYSKSVRDAVKDYEAQIDEMKKINVSIKNGEKGVGPLDPSKYSDEEIKKVQLLVEALKQLFPFLAPEKSSGSGRQSDPRLQTLQEIANKMAEVNKEYDELLKKEGQTKALADTQKLFASSFEQMKATAKKYGFKLPALEVPQTIEDVQKWYKAISDEIKRLGIKNADKVLIELGFKSDKAAIDKQQKDIESELKRLADRISRTKTAKEFYEKILSQTGDVELATRVSLSIYGSTGEELFEDTVKQIREVFKSGKEDVVIDLEPVFDMTNQRIDYKMLADIYEKYQNDIIDKNRDTAKKIAQEGQKTTASNIANWQKELAKAKDFEQRRMDIIRTAAAEREKIIKEVRDPEERESLLNLSREKESQDLSKLNFEEFTKSEDYIKIFENLDNTATSTLKRLRTELQALIDTNKDLSPENMKTLVKAMEDIDEQISGRGFGNDMVQSVNDYIASIKNLKIAKQELAKAEAEYEAQEPRLDADIETAKAEKESAVADVVAAQQELLDIQTQMVALREQEIVDETQLAALQAQEVAASNALTAAERKQNQAATAVVNAEQAKAKAADKVKKAEQKVSGEQDKQKKATTKFFKDLQQVAATADQLASVLGDVQEALGISEDSAAGLVFDSAIQGLQEFSKIMNVIIGLQTLYNIVTSSNPWLAIAAAVLAVGSILGSWISGSKVRKANKEIERQQELLDQLEYTYGRLEKAADKLFGADYLNNYNQQIKNLQAQQRAYLKQAEAERSKGKKADEEKIKEYENQARDTADAIKELQDDLVAQIVGTDVASVARDFANAWLDAYLSFGSTTDAIKEKFDDMIKNMIVNMVLAQVVKRALEPIFKMIDDLAADGELSADDIAKVFAMVPQSMQDINNGLSVGVEALKAAGVDISKLRDGSSEFSGIAKNIAGASEETINTAAAIGNTIMYHTSHIPIISQNVAAMYQLMSQGKTAAIDSGSTGWTDWQQQAMENYNAIARNTADTVVRCERAAVACEAMAEKMGRIIVAKGGKFAVNTTYI